METAVGDLLIVKGFESVRGVVDRLMTLQDPEILRSLNRHGAIATRITSEERKYGYHAYSLPTSYKSKK